MECKVKYCWGPFFWGETILELRNSIWILNTIGKRAPKQCSGPELHCLIFSKQDCVFSERTQDTKLCQFCGTRDNGSPQTVLGPIQIRNQTTQVGCMLGMCLNFVLFKQWFPPNIFKTFTLVQPDLKHCLALQFLSLVLSAPRPLN